MNTLNIFLSEFRQPLITALVAVLVLWLLRRYDACRLLISPKAFAELAAYPAEEQRRLLHEASIEAFRNWRALVPLVAFAFFFVTGIAVAHTVPKVTSIPDSWWTQLLVLMAFAIFGAWLVGALTTRYVRPFLRVCLQRLHQGS